MRVTSIETTGEASQWAARLGWSVAAFVVAYAAGVLIAVVILAQGGWTNGLAWERAVLLGIDHTLPTLIDYAMLALPWLGTNLTVMPVLVGVAIWLGRSRRRWDLAAQLVVVTTGSLLLNAAMKGMLDRPRPAFWQHRGQYAFASYPSGHAIVSVAVYFTVAYLLHREKGWRWPYVVAAIQLAISVFSRHYLGVHWPTDVLAGVVIGLVWLGGTMYAFRRPADARTRLPGAARAPRGETDSPAGLSHR